MYAFNNVLVCVFAYIRTYILMYVNQWLCSMCIRIYVHAYVSGAIPFLAHVTYVNAPLPVRWWRSLK